MRRAIRFLIFGAVIATPAFAGPLADLSRPAEAVFFLLLAILVIVVVAGLSRGRW